MMRSRFSFLLILLGYLFVTLAYGVVNPLFEAPDEHWHYFTAHYIADNGRLPVVEEDYDEWLGQEAAQPPLYYALGALLIAPLDTAGTREQVWLNPYAWIGNASALANINRVVHTATEAWPWQGYVLAAHLLRILSTLFGLGTLLAIYGSGRLLWPDDPVPALLATGLVAFLPQFNFIHAAITNDTLITLLCSLVLYQLIRLWQMDIQAMNNQSMNNETMNNETMNNEQTRFHCSLSHCSLFIILGSTIGLAILTKTAGLLLLIYTIGFLILLAIRDGRLRQLPPVLGMVVVTAVLVGGWLWWRNWMLYGDPTAANQFIRIAGGDRGYTLGQVLAESEGLLLSVVAVFGWFNVRPPNWVYWLWGGVALLALIGLLYCLFTAVQRTRSSIQPQGFLPTLQSWLRQPWMLALLLAGWIAAVYAGLLTFMMQTEAAQGRLMFPTILPLALGAALGLVGAGRYAGRSFYALLRRFSPFLIGLLFLTTLYCLLNVIRPAYARPMPVAAIPSNVQTVLPELADRGRGIRLLATAVETPGVSPGEIARFTFYWQSNRDLPAEAAAAPEFVLELFGRDVARVGNLHSYHGRGLYPANLWPPGVIVADQFAVRVDEQAAVPALGRVFARLAGENPGIEVATVKLVPQQWPEPPSESVARLGESIELVSVSVRPELAQTGDVVTASVRWYVSGPAPSADFTTLLHFGEPDRSPLATGDRPPLNGDYPTRVWETGEVIDDSYTLTIPEGLESGRYPVWIGMYDPNTGQRLPLTIDDEPQPNNVYLAGWVEIVE